MRAACLSEAGRIARSEWMITRALARGIRRVPGLKSYVHPAGYRGRYVRGPIGNGLVDRSWPVRVAAALALGDCRSPAQVPALERLLSAPYRAERIAAAAAIVASGGVGPRGGTSLLSGGLPVPDLVGDSSPSADVLAALASAHEDVLSRWRTLSSEEQPRNTTPQGWAEFLAGPRATERASSLQAEIDRYDADGETEYVLTKPFSPINRLQNPRLLHTFAAVCEQLHAPANARVLDLGGGSGWVSELLAKFGYTPITLDASSALLGIGKRRFDRQGLTPRLVAGDMTKLPLASASVNAAIVIDALHHVPDVPAVFKEVFRVLETGGVFVLAEPGEGHSETEKARGEILEFGVHEREIHALEAFDYAERAGFDDVRLVPNPVPAISMTRKQLVRAMSSPAGRWMVLNNDRLGYLAPYVIQSMLGHPLLVCRKGKRAVDSRAPGMLRAEILPKIKREGARISGIASVRNTGDTLWLAGSAQGHVQLGVQLLGADRSLILLDFARAGLAQDVAPGKSAEVALDFQVPDAIAPYVLKFDFVDEGVCWFQDAGSQPVYIAV
jgi:SAM-dependent methyltransferase